MKHSKKWRRGGKHCFKQNKIQAGKANHITWVSPHYMLHLLASTAQILTSGIAVQKLKSHFISHLMPRQLHSSMSNKKFISNPWYSALISSHEVNGHEIMGAIVKRWFHLGPNSLGPLRPLAKISPTQAFEGKPQRQSQSQTSNH